MAYADWPLAVIVYRGEGPRIVEADVPDIDGSPIELELRWRRRGGSAQSLALSSADGSLLVLAGALRFTLTADQIDDLPDRGTTGDVFRHVDGDREKVGAFSVEVLGAGEWRG